MLTAKQLLESLTVTSSRESKGVQKTVKKSLYTQLDDAYFAQSTPPPTHKALPAGVYEIKSSMSGIYATPHTIETDELIRFDDPRHQLVLSEIQKFWDSKDRFKQAGFTHKRGMLLTGAPGTGKTCLLKMVMEDVVKADDLVFYVSSPDMLRSYVEWVKQIEPKRNVLAVMEDVDEICRYNEHSMLQLMDGDNQFNNFLILATTNYPERLPPRMMRPGRFDRKLEIGPIPEAGRYKYFELKLSQASTAEEDTVQEYTDLCDGFSFAQMREFLVSVLCLGYNAREAAARVRSGSIEEAAGMTEAQLNEKLGTR